MNIQERIRQKLQTVLTRTDIVPNEVLLGEKEAQELDLSFRPIERIQYVGTVSVSNNTANALSRATHLHLYEGQLKIVRTRYKSYLSLRVSKELK